MTVVGLALVAGVLGGCALALLEAYLDERAAHRRTIDLLRRWHERARAAELKRATGDVAEAPLVGRRTPDIRHYGAN